MKPSNADLTRAFNTAMVGTRIDAETNSPTLELMSLVETPAYQTILDAIALHADRSGLSLAASAEEVIRTFRRVDRLWSDFVYAEGVARIRGPKA